MSKKLRDEDFEIIGEKVASGLAKVKRLKPEKPPSKVSDDDVTDELVNLDVEDDSRDISDETGNVIDGDDLYTKSKEVKGTRDAVSLVVVSRIVTYVDEIVKEIDELITSFRNAERNVVTRIYPRRFRMVPGLLKEKLLIFGSDKADILTFHSKFFEFLKTATKRRVELEKQIDDMVTENPQHILVAKRDLKLQITGIELVSWVLENLREFTSQFAPFEPPKSLSVELAKDFRSLLTRTMAIARQAEILFTDTFSELLRIHSELRQDYAELEVQVGMIYNNLFVSRAAIYMSDQEFSKAFRTIVSVLQNVRGDFKSLKVKLLMNVRVSGESGKKMRAYLKRLTDVVNKQKMRAIEDEIGEDD